MISPNLYSFSSFYISCHIYLVVLLDYALPKLPPWVPSLFSVVYKGFLSLKISIYILHNLLSTIATFTSSNLHCQTWKSINFIKCTFFLLPPTSTLKNDVAFLSNIYWPLSQSYLLAPNIWIYNGWHVWWNIYNHCPKNMFTCIHCILLKFINKVFTIHC